LHITWKLLACHLDRLRACHRLRATRKDFARATGWEPLTHRVKHHSLLNALHLFFQEVGLGFCAQWKRRSQESGVQAAERVARSPRDWTRPWRAGHVVFVLAVPVRGAGLAGKHRRSEKVTATLFGRIVSVWPHFRLETSLFRAFFGPRRTCRAVGSFCTSELGSWQHLVGAFHRVLNALSVHLLSTAFFRIIF